MVVSGIVYVPDIIEHDAIDDTDIIELYKNGLYNAWKNIGTMSPRLIRLLFGETIAVRESYNHIIENCHMVKNKVEEYQAAWRDVYKRDVDLFNDKEEGWRPIVALTPDHEYLGHVYIRRGSRFGTYSYLSWNQLDYLEMRNLTNTLCPPSNHHRLSVSGVLMHGIQESIHVNKLLGVYVLMPLSHMRTILKNKYKFRPIGGGRLTFHMRSTVEELMDTLNKLGATDVECINTPMVFAPCESFVEAAVADYTSSRIGNFTKSKWNKFLLASNLMTIVFEKFQADPCLSITALRKMDISSTMYTLLPTMFR